jgi:TorA maturation chaperone TorD
VTTPARWADVALLRQGLYRFFGGALLPPGDGRIDQLGGAASYLESLGIGSFAFGTAWFHLSEMLETPPDRQQLSADYTRLFVSGAVESLCPPVESFYRADARSGAAAGVTAGVERDYAAVGLRSSAAGFPPDHATAELEAMSVLAGKEHQAWLEEDPEAVSAIVADEMRFLRRHLSVWFPMFHRRVVANDEGGFYGRLVAATHSFTVHDADLMTAARTDLEGAA